MIATVVWAVPQAPTAAAQAAAPAKCTGGMKDSRGRSAVDQKEIRREDETRFNDAYKHANRVWSANGLKQVKIRPDSSSTIADLQWCDVNRTGGGWQNTPGRYTPHTGADDIYLNRAYLGTGKRHGNTKDRRRVAAHELGHALGFCHKSPSWYSTLMAEKVTSLPGNGKPTQRDRSDYHRLWG